MKEMEKGKAYIDDERITVVVGDASDFLRAIVIDKSNLTSESSKLVSRYLNVVGDIESQSTNKAGEHMKALKEVYRELKQRHKVDLLDIKENAYLRDWLSSSSQ